MHCFGGSLHIMTHFPYSLCIVLGVGFNIMIIDYNDPFFFGRNFPFNIWGMSQYQLRNTDHLRYQNGTKVLGESNVMRKKLVDFGGFVSLP